MRLFSLWGSVLLLAGGCGEVRDGSARRVPRDFSAVQVERAREAAAKVEGAGLMRYVEELVEVRARETPTVPSWGDGKPYVRFESARYLEETFRALGFEPTVERFESDGLAVSNLYVDIPGTVRPNELVVLTAHYDSWFPGAGADDNASGVAALLEAARILKDAKPDRTVRLVAFDAEEIGAIGSSRFAQGHAAEDVVVLVNLDCVGFASRERGSQQAPPGLGLRDTGDFLAGIANGDSEDRLAQLAGLSAVLESVPVVGLVTPGDGYYAATTDFLRSDHAPFWRYGVPALFLTDTADFRNAHYHTASDTPDTLDPEFFQRGVRLIIGAVAAYAEED